MSSDHIDPDEELAEIEADVKELTRECKRCSAPGILMSSGVLDQDWGDDGRPWGEEYRVWYCEAHVDDYIADGAYSAAIWNDLGDDAGPESTEALTHDYLRRLGWSEERIAAVSKDRAGGED